MNELAADRANAPDAELLNCAAAGDAEAFALLVDRHYGLAYAVARARLDDPETIDDLVQEVFLRAFLYAPKMENPERFAPWLACVTRNMAINWQKSARRRSPILKALPLEHATGVPDMAKGARETMNEVQRNQLLEEALQTLDEDERELVLLHYAQGWPKRRIAQELGLHAATVGRKIDRVLEKLKGRLEVALQDEAPKMLSSSAKKKQAAALVAAVAALPALKREALAAELAAETQALAAAAGTGAAAGAGAAGGFSVAKLAAVAAAVVVAVAIGTVSVISAQGGGRQVASPPVVNGNGGGEVKQVDKAPDEPPVVKVAQATPGDANAAPADSGPAIAPDKLAATLGGDIRASTHVSTDKPIYRLGEKVYIRAVTLNAFTRMPIIQGRPQFEILSPKGSSVTSGRAEVIDGAAGWAWEIPAEMAGGEYTARVKWPHEGYAPAERKFDIRAFRAPRFRTQIEFVREGYGPSDEVVATMSATRAEGGVPFGVPVTMIARVDEVEVWRGETTVSNAGVVEARFHLPDTIVYGNGTLSFIIQDGGVVETAAKTIPILLSHVDLAVYPEGGYLVPGVPNRVYFEATAPTGRPADIVAELVDVSGAVVLQTRAEHEGRGRFVFTPEAGNTYTLKVVEPWTVTTEVSLGEMKGDGVTLFAVDERIAASVPLVIRVGAALPRNVSLTVSQREKEVARADASIGGDDEAVREIVLALPEDASGVLRVTAWDSGSGLPVAERLVFREPKNQVSVEIEADRKFYTPGSPVTLTVRTRDENGNAVPSFVGMIVTDDATLELIEDRQKAPRLPVQVFVENDVRELADAQIYLSEDEEAPLALDLLLGTQGWRRFAFIDPNKFKEEHGDEARRVLANRETYWNRLDFARAVPMAAAPEMAMMQKTEAKEEAVDLMQEDGEVRAEGLGIDDRAEADAVEKMPKVVAREPLGRLEADQVAQERRLNALADRASFYEPMALVREYAHSARENRNENDRMDFTETVYWSAATETDENGEATISFDLSDSVTSFRAMADVWTSKGTIGAGDVVIESRRPFYVEVKTPLEVSTGDQILLPVSVVNDTDDSITAAVAVSLSSGLAAGDFQQAIDLGPHSRERILIPVSVNSETEDQEILVTASSGTMVDHVTRKIPAKAVGFPVRVSRSGILDNNVTHRFTIPDSTLPHGLKAKVELYPSPVANLTSALESLIRDPHGCFEQTSSTNYPLVMAMQYFDTHSGVDPVLVATSREKLDSGYKRLVGYETADNGFEWFGQNPPHEALTAYGLLEFSDMREIYPVDQAMIDRTREWLLSRRDGKGGFKRNDKALDSFGRAPENVTNAYIVWALATAGETNIAKEVDAVASGAMESKDAYVIALAAGALQNAGRAEEAAPLLGRLAQMQNEDGSIDKAETSITGSGGKSLLLETTSLALLAWLNESAYAGNTEKAMRWIASQCEGGAFGSTQSTVLALKAIVEYDKARSAERKGGTVTVLVNGQTVDSIAYEGDRKEAIMFDVARYISRGEQNVEMRLADGSPMPYSLTVDYFAEIPANDEACPLDWDVVLASDEVMEGEAIEMIATIRNKTDDGLPMTLAVVGLPGGLEPRHDQLKELVEEGVIDFYEVIGRDVVLYWRDMAPNEEKRVTLSTIAAVPGKWRGAASRAGLYYMPESRRWIEGLPLVVSF